MERHGEGHSRPLTVQWGKAELEPEADSSSSDHLSLWSSGLGVKEDWFPEVTTLSQVGFVYLQSQVL